MCDGRMSPLPPPLRVPQCTHLTQTPPPPRQTCRTTPHPPSLPPNSLLAWRRGRSELDSVARPPAKVSGLDFCPAKCRLHSHPLFGFKINGEDVFDINMHFTCCPSKNCDVRGSESYAKRTFSFNTCPCKRLFNVCEIKKN